MNQQTDLPLVSIITVVYNGAKTLEQTILSVFNQTYTNIEYIIIDGGSKDDSVKIIEKYSTRLKYWISEKDNGIYDAMNKGVSHASGELIGIINSDDWYEVDAVKNIVTFSNVNPEVDIIHGLLRFVNDEGQMDSIAGHPHDFLKTGMIEHPTCFVKRKLYEKIGSFDTSYKAAADYDFVNRAKKQGAKFLFIDYIIANFRRGGVTSTPVSFKEELKLKLKYGHISKLKYFKWFIITRLLTFK